MPGTVRISGPVVGDARRPTVDLDELLDRTPDAQAREREALVGSTLVDRYRIEAELGRGGMGAVYRARHVVLDKPIALKILHADIADDAESRERFLREARIAASVKHEHLVDVSDFGEVGAAELPGLGPHRRPWFVLELLEGETLGARLDRERTVAPREAATIFEQVARGLAAAHRAGAVHRDVKPDNVFLARKDGRTSVKVLDFGVARLLSASRLTRQGIVFGSPHYMSPEQASGLEIDGRSDVYSVGVALYEALSGRLPFEADSTTGVLTKHVYVEPEPIEAVVRDPAALGDLGEVVMRCLAKRPEARYPSADALADALGRVARGAPLASLAAPRPHASETASAPRTEARPAPRPRPALLLTAAALATLACALGVVVLVKERRASVDPASATPDGERAASPRPRAATPTSRAAEAAPSEVSEPNSPRDRGNSDATPRAGVEGRATQPVASSTPSAAPTPSASTSDDAAPLEARAAPEGDRAPTASALAPSAVAPPATTPSAPPAAPAPSSERIDIFGGP